MDDAVVTFVQKMGKLEFLELPPPILDNFGVFNVGVSYPIRNLGILRAFYEKRAHFRLKMGKNRKYNILI